MTPVLVSAEWLLDNIDRVRVLDASSHLPTVKRDAEAEFLVIEGTRMRRASGSVFAFYGLSFLLPRYGNKKWIYRAHGCITSPWSSSRMTRMVSKDSSRRSALHGRNA